VNMRVCVCVFARVRMNYWANCR